MGADQDVYLPRADLLLDGFDVFGRSESVDVVHLDRKIFKAFRQGLVMLHGQDCGGHQDGNLLSIVDRFECRTDGDLCFAKTHIPANESVHGIGFFHICLYICCWSSLVRCVLIQERGFELHLQHRISWEGKAWGRPAFGIERYQVFGNVLDLFFDPCFFIFPVGGAQLRHGGCLSFLAWKFRNLV